MGMPNKVVSGDKLIAKVFHVAAGALAKGRAAQKITVALIPFVSHHRNGLGIQEKAMLVVPAFLHDPVAAQFLYNQTQVPRPPVELALINQFGKQRQVVGTDEPQILRFAWIRNVVLRQNQGDDLAIRKSGFCPRLSLSR